MQFQAEAPWHVQDSQHISLCLVIITASHQPIRSPTKVDFGRDVLPIFADSAAIVMAPPSSVPVCGSIAEAP